MNNNNNKLQRAALLATLLGVVSVSASVLSGCATQDQLFTKYDKTCDLPEAKVITKVKIVKQIEKQGIAGLHWEPAVYFGFDLATLEAKETERLAKDVAILVKKPELKVNIQAFTDVKGSSRYNHQLALRRQNAVVVYMEQQGISRERILLSPLGEELPILGNSKSERSINRRVELMLLDHSGRPLALEIKPKQTGFTPPLPVK